MNHLAKIATYSIKNAISKILPDLFFKRIPDDIIIEPTNVCNLKCPVCPTTFGMKRKTGFLKFETFKGIIDDLKPYKKKPQISMNFHKYKCNCC
jgi:MoaA/NifB/PqqE/SkfB family radical SAM enzyme